MLTSSLLLALLPQSTVDLQLTPASQCAPAGSIIEVQLVLSASAPTALTGVDVLLTWDPAALQFQSATPSGVPWFVAGFLNDPDSINANIFDGDALYTLLGSPASPPSLPPSITAAKFKFQVLADGQVSMPAMLGTFGKTQVVGVLPGQVVTGTIGGPATIDALSVPSLEVVRLGVPPNPNAFLPGLTNGPVIGKTWDPVVDHTSFVPGALLDAFVITLSPTNLSLPPAGTALCLPPIAAGPFLSGPGVPFSIPIKNKCSFVGVSLCAQGFSLGALGNLFLTNALDFTIGTF